MLAVLGVLSVQQARATTPAQALQSCYNVAASLPGGNNQAKCTPVQTSQSAGYYQLSWQDPRQTPPTPHPADSDKRYFYTGSACADKPTYPGSVGDNITVCQGGCLYAPREDDDGAQTDTVRSGSWFASLKSVTYVPTGGTCAGDVPPPPIPPHLCGGSSCIETGGSDFCAKASDGTVVCVPRPNPGAPGTCSSGGGTTLCAGNPPPLPPNPPIVDPATDIAGTDTYGHQSGSGTINNTTVNNFNNTGSPASNGGASGDAGNAPGSPAAPPGSPNGPPKPEGEADHGSYSGGGDCNTPPICSGDKPTCGVVDQVWLSRCKGPGKASSSAQPEWTKVGPGDAAVYDDVPAAEPGFVEEKVVDASMIESTGWVGNSCPALPQAGPLHLEEYQDFWCAWLSKIRAVFLIFGAFVAVKIIAGGRG